MAGRWGLGHKYRSLETVAYSLMETYILIPEGKLTRIFVAGRKILAVAKGANPADSLTSVYRFQKSVFTRKVPADRLKEFSKAVSRKSGSTRLDYYTTPKEVLVSNTYMGFFIKDFTSKQMLHFVRGQKRSLLSFVNCNLLTVKNVSYVTNDPRELLLH